MARALASRCGRHSLLDYGCGDGTFVALVNESFEHVLGADLDAADLARSRARFSTLGGVSFALISELEPRKHDQAYEVVTCMEVLEHCVPESEARVLSDLHRLVAPDGTVLISVPVETGISLLVKEAMRTVAAWQRLGDYRYKEQYRTRELLKMVFASKDTVVARPVYGSDPEHHGHKGFNWRALRERLGAWFLVKDSYFTPVPLFGSALASQVWFVCHPK